MADTKAPPAVLAGCVALGVGIGFVLWRCTAEAEPKSTAPPPEAPAEGSPSPHAAGRTARSVVLKVPEAPPAPVEDEFDVEVEVQQVELFEEVLTGLAGQGGESVQKLPALLQDYRKVLEDGLPGRGKELRAASTALEAALCVSEDEDGLSASLRLGQEPSAFKDLMAALQGLLAGAGSTKASCPPEGCGACNNAGSCGSKAESPAVQIGSGGAVKLA